MIRIIADENMPKVREAFAALGDIDTLSGRSMTPESVRDVDVLLVRSVTRVNAELLDGSRVRFVGTATIGTDHIDNEYLADQGIRFAYAPGSNADSVADYITAALLETAAEFDIDLHGRTIGVIGVGNVGSRVVKRAEALGMIPLINDPPLARESGGPEGAAYLPLENLLAADFITLHVPLTRDGGDATHHLMDEALLSRLKPGAILLNSSRGAVVAGDALSAALTSGRLRAAVLDVWEDEPRISPDLLRHVTLGTPHIAGYAFDGKINGTAMLYESLCEFLGIPASWDREDALPPPEREIIELSTQGKSNQEVLREAARHVYDIRRDDAALREMLALSTEEQTLHFDRLRKEYPIRREFSRYQVRSATCDRGLAEALRGLSFSVAGPLADAR